MNKADLVNLVAARTELTKTDVSLVVDAAIDTIIDSVVEGKKVSILGFGSFEPRDRSARQGLNPKTGEKKRGTITKKRKSMYRVTYEDGKYYSKIPIALITLLEKGID